jgi:hypothetical protein
MASTGPDPPRRPAPPRVGVRPLWGLSIWTGLGGPDLPFPRKGSGATTCRLKLSGRLLLGQPCHVPVAEGLPWGVSPSTALNAGRWTVRAQVKVWPAHQHTGKVSWHHGKPACFQGGASYHSILCASGVQSTHGTARVGNDGLLQESRGARCHSARGGGCRITGPVKRPRGG